MQLASLDDLFSTQASRDEAQREKVQEIPLEELHPFAHHPFKVLDDDRMKDTADSIREYGVLVPAIARPCPDGGYELIAGHRRKRGCEWAGLKTMPVIVRELDDDASIIIMVDSNLQREKILPSERAFAYKMRLEAMKRQGQRNDLTCATPLHKSGKKSREILAEQVGESYEQVRKFIRLTSLIPELLELVDNSVLKEKDKLQIALRPAVELSYLKKEEQEDLFQAIQDMDCTPSHVQAIKMRQFSQQGRLDSNVIFSILEEEKPNQKEQFKIPKERISKYFAPGTPVQKIEDTIVKALELYRKRQRSMER